MSNRTFSTIFKTKSCWFVADSDYEEMISKRSDIELDDHTFEIRNFSTDKVYVHSFALNVSVKPISQYEKKNVEYDKELCDEIYEKGFRIYSDKDITDYSQDVSIEQFIQYMSDNHYSEYVKTEKDRDYIIYNKGKVCAADLSDFYIQPQEPSSNPFKHYVEEHNNFMKDCPYTYYAYDTKYQDYCILHLITGPTNYNPWTKSNLTTVYGVQKYCYNPETDKVQKLFIYGKPHVESFIGKYDDNIVICCESFVKAWVLYRTMKKKYSVITTHSKYIRDNDLRYINEHFPNYSLCVFCDTDEETMEITTEIRSKYSYFPTKEKQLRDIYGITGNTKGLDINDSIRNATKMIRSYITNRDKLIETKRRFGLQ